MGCRCVCVCGGDGKDCWPWVWAGGERSLRRQVEKCGGGEQVQSSGHHLQERQQGAGLW